MLPTYFARFHYLAQVPFTGFHFYANELRRASDFFCCSGYAYPYLHDLTPSLDFIFLLSYTVLTGCHRNTKEKRIFMELTKDADKMICCIYKTFLQRRKNGMAKSEARRFDDDYFSTDEKLSIWPDGDISDTFLEIGRAKLIQIYIGGNFDLTDQGIIYMENRFKNGFIEVGDFISLLIP